MQFLNTISDIEWILSTHLKEKRPLVKFESFIIYGNEDCPTKIELFQASEPLVTDQPIAIYELNSNLKYNQIFP